jgi:type VI secretion system protein ImpM
MIPLPPDASAGLFGKLPARGDFVRENLPRDFTDAWDAWWQRGLADVQARWPEAWRDAWLEAPIWRFMLPPGLCGKSGILGVWVPSVDKVGRYSPLTIAAAAACDWLPYVRAMTPFLESAEAAAREALEHDLTPAEVMERIQPALVLGDTPDPDPGFVHGHTAWWTEGGPRVGARFEVGVALPEGSRFAAFMEDKWGDIDGGLPSGPRTSDAS